MSNTLDYTFFFLWWILRNNTIFKKERFGGKIPPLTPITFFQVIIVRALNYFDTERVQKSSFQSSLSGRLTIITKANNIFLTLSLVLVRIYFISILLLFYCSTHIIKNTTPKSFQTTITFLFHVALAFPHNHNTMLAACSLRTKNEAFRHFFFANIQCFFFF